MPFLSPVAVSVLLHCSPFPLSVLPPFISIPIPLILSVSFHLHSLHLHLIIVPHTPALCKDENEKTANPTASYGIRVCQPTMLLSDLFSSQNHSLCGCIHPTLTPHPPLSLNKSSGCCIFSCKPSCNVTSISFIEKQREKEWLSMLHPHNNLRLGRGEISTRHLPLPGWVVVGFRWGWWQTEIIQKEI